MTPLLKFPLLSCLILSVVAQEPAKEPPKPAPEQKQEQEKEKEAPKTLQLGQRVNGLVTLNDLDGKAVKAADHMGKVTVVSFYSIQCPIQRAWDQRLAQLQKDFEPKGVVFLHIDSNVTEIGAEPPRDGEDSAYDKIKAHLKEKELPFRVLADHGNKVADLFDAKTTPHVYVFGKDGRLVYKGLVDDDQKDRNPDARNNYVHDVVTKLLADEKVEPFATKEQGCTIKRVDAAGGRGQGQRGGGRRRGGQAGGQGGG